MRKPLHVIAAGLGAVALAFATPVSAQQKLKIGVITTLSGPQGLYGKLMRDSVELALDHLNRKVGGLETEIVYGDDQLKPDVAVQIANDMIKRDRVDFVTGVIWSNVLLAVEPVITGAGKILVGTNAGPSPLAGSKCNELFFSTSWQSDAISEAMGKFMQDANINDVYTIVPNYQAGKDIVAGFKRYFKGRIVEEVYTKLGQQEYQAEITQLRSKNPKAVFVFLPGGMGIQFIRQYIQAGLREQIPLYSVFTVDETTIPALKDAAVGQYETRFWSLDIDVPASKRYVADFRTKFGYAPSYSGAQTYDGIMLIDSAVRAVGGKVENTKGMVAAMRKADFASVRGKFRYNTNHFPIQDFYLLKAVKGGPDGVQMLIEKKVFSNHVDAYHKDCKMKW